MESSLYKNGMKEKAEANYSASDRLQKRLYRREFGFAMGVYLILWAALSFLTEREGVSDTWWMVLFLPLIAAAITGLRSYLRADEYQRMRQLQAIAVGFVAAMLASLFLGLMGAAGVATVWSGWVVYSVGMLSWCAAALVQQARDA